MVGRIYEPYNMTLLDVSISPEIIFFK